MIIIQARGGLGNQMFQYAFGVALSKRLGCNFIISRNDLTETSAFFITDYFKLDLYHQIVVSGNYILGKIHDGLIARIAPKFNEYVDDKNDTNGINKYTFIKGFFQSERYFIEYFDEVEKRFQIKKKFIKQFRRKYKNYSRNYAVVHVRLGDYKEFGSEYLGGIDMTLPITYYRKSIKKLEDEYSINKFIIISDDINEAKKIFGSDERFIFNKGSVIEDFLLLKEANYTIISNSTFAWWASYLNKSNSIIIAPKYWLGFKINSYYPPNIMTDKFHWESVY